MKLFRYALKNMKPEFVAHLLTGLQLSAVIVITMIMVSTVLLRYQYYSPFRDVFGSNGFYGFFMRPATVNENGTQDYTDYVADEELRRYLEGASDIISCNRGPAWCIDDNSEPINGKPFISLHYDDAIIERFTPGLKEGRWLNTSQNASCMEAVISQNDYGWKVGDRIRLGFFADEIQDIYQEVLIVGELKENTKIIQIPDRSFNERTFNLLFGTASYEIEQQPFVIFSANYISDNTTICQGVFGPMLATYPDDYPEEKLKEERRNLSQINCFMTIPLRDIEAESRAYLWEQVYNLFPVVLILAILVTVSGISSSALSVRRELKSYVIFYITGLRWRQCCLISLIQAAVVSAGAILFSGGVAVFLSVSEISEHIKLIFAFPVVLAVMVIVAGFLLISMVMPLFMLSRTSPRQLLVK